MKEQLPPPDFDANQYERPNQNWTCGKEAAEGKACRIGPDATGRCRASFECKPFLELKEGETKGHWRCTRTTECGGPCEPGPRPDGACCRPITKCVPARTLRAKRRRFTWWVMAVTVGGLLVALYGPLRARFINPGEVSAQHSTETFARLSGAGYQSEGGCGACHVKGPNGPRGWLAATFGAMPGPFDFHGLASTDPPSMTVIDESCARCHEAHTFHQPNVVRDHSCSACHEEHRGRGPMPAPTDANCLSCHANEQVMLASLEMGRSLPAEAFDFRPDQGRVMFRAARPGRGYTQIIHSFAGDHPEFQALAAKLKDPNPLRFNHQLHLTSASVAREGHKLDCADCHKPDASGVFHLKITFEENCRSCHSLQFDVNNPGLHVPHGNPEHVRAFLRSLPLQYTDYAKANGITGKRELDEFVQRQMIRIREQVRSGEDLEQQVFFSNARTAPASRVGELPEQGRARFAGCAYCHEVMPADGGGAPQVSHPVIPDRWLVRGRFDHSKHLMVGCVNCHEVTGSRETSDILLPAKASCVECHSPRGGVRHSCSTCHSFHSPRRTGLVRQSDR